MDTSASTTSHTDRQYGALALGAVSVLAGVVITYLVVSVILEAIGIDVPLVNWPF
jgi:hypothetical protein